MIEATVKEVDGVQFIDKVKIVSWERKYGIPIQEVGAELFRESRTRNILESLMLEEVDYDFARKTIYFAQRPVNDIVYRFIKFSISVYWHSLWFLHDNTGMFKQIPENECFSWRYFTPYVWYRRLRGQKGI